MCISQATEEKEYEKYGKISLYVYCCFCHCIFVILFQQSRNGKFLRNTANAAVNATKYGVPDCMDAHLCAYDTQLFYGVTES